MRKKTLALSFLASVAGIMVSCGFGKVYPTCHVAVTAAVYDPLLNEIRLSITHDGAQPDVVYYIPTTALSIEGRAFASYMPTDLDDDDAVLGEIAPVIAPGATGMKIVFDTDMVVDVTNSQTSFIYMPDKTYTVPFQFITPEIAISVPAP